MEEMFDIVDEDGNITGEIISRSTAHQYGIRHRTAHCWLVRKRNNHIEILVQKRSENKDSYPGCYDISSAGHIPAGVDYRDSAVREIKEELGIDIKQEELIYCGKRRYEYTEIFNGHPFHDHEVTNVYMVYVEDPVFTIQEEELSEVRWFEFNELYEHVVHNTLKHCIMIEELDKVKAKLKNEL